MGVAALSPFANAANAANAQNFQGVMSGDSGQESRRFDSVTAPLQMFSTGGLATKIKARLLPRRLRVLVAHAQQRDVLVALWCHCSYGQKGTRVKTKCCFFFFYGAARPPRSSALAFSVPPHPPDGRTFPSSRCPPLLCKPEGESRGRLHGSPGCQQREINK